MEWHAPKIIRRKSRKIMVGNVQIGDGAPISVQSMTTTDTNDIKGTVEQINQLAKVGADIVRVSVPTMQAAESFGQICKQVSIPVVADIHFDYRIAIEVAKLGAGALRINPGNIGSRDKVEAVCQAAKDYGLPIRVGVNAGSLDKDLLKKYNAPCPEAMVEAALRSADILHDHNFYNYAFSVKASELFLCTQAYELLATKTDAPLHLGITEAGGLMAGSVLSSIGISKLLLQGIGDTIRVSLAADPIEEIKVGYSILKSLHLRTRGVDIVACPTCARHGIDVVGTVGEIENRLKDVTDEIKVAVMGCIVNGPGEALRAEVAVCGGNNGQCLVYEDGTLVGKIKDNEVVDVLEKRIRDKVAKNRELKIKSINKE